ncbi:MAG: hypothetical protein JXR83_12435 [Deltaproteobacteria bacterium]|nr:hypothetical protein [Deltaproteobacteria bacterium]
MTKALQKDLVSAAVVVINGQARNAMLPGRLAHQAPVPDGAHGQPLASTAGSAPVPALPLLQLGRARTAAFGGDALLATCPEHGERSLLRCTKCGRPICGRCSHLLINRRAWCLRCGRGYRSHLLRTLGQVVLHPVKFGVVVGAAVAVMFLLPAPLVARAIVAEVVGVLLARWLLLGSGLPDAVVCEVKPRRRAVGTHA